MVLADTRRLEHSFPAVDYFERRGIRFVLAVNEFDGSYRYTPDEVRAAIDLDPGVPVLLCDARRRDSATGVLVSLIQHLLDPRSAHALHPA